MADAAAPVTGRRLPRGLFGALVAFLLLPFPALCLAGPLAGWLLLVRPRSAREWGWLAAALALAAAGIATGGRSAAGTIITSYGVAFTGAFLAVMLWRPGPALPRATATALDTALLVAVAAWALGIPWAEIRGAVDAQLQEGVTLVVGGSGMSAERVERMRQTMRVMAGLYPGIAVLGAMAGGTLAHAVAWHVTGGRTAPEPGAFRAFRFNDHLIWGAIVTLALVVAPLRGPWDLLAANALVVWVGLYTARGAAVAGTLLSSWPAPLRVTLGIAAVLLLPYALGALLVLGLADTWVDLRRTAGPPNEGVT